MRNIILKFLCCLILTSTSFLKAEDIIDEMDSDTETTTEATKDQNAPALYTEVIKNISPSKKIFILTNDNQSFGKGDFITLLNANQLVCRALVAKTTENKLSGIKILKIYSMPLWEQLKVEKEVLVLRGDDSYFTTKENLNKKSDENSKKKKGKKEDSIDSEEDLYSSTSINSEDDPTNEDQSKRFIKPDNLLSLNYGLIKTTHSYAHLNGSWAYQLTDNIWAEAGIGTNTIRDYPNENKLGGLDTRLTSYSLKFKYTMNAPFYSYIMPYIGYQVISANSPGAGVDDGSGSTTPEQRTLEVQDVENLKRSGVIFGMTVLKRIVPGWFVRLDLGTDIINGGMTLEF